MTDLDTRSVASPPAKTPPPPWLSYINPMGWPKWLKWVVGVPLFIVLVFYFRDQRMGNGIFAPSGNDYQLEGGVALKIKKSELQVAYADGTLLAPDGIALAVVTADDDTSAPDRLHAFRALITTKDFPVVVFFNATGFDATGEPICIRRAADGKELYKVNGAGKVRLLVSKRSGTFDVYGEGQLTPTSLSEKDWVEKYMRLKYEVVDPKELDKLSDEELAKRGFKRAPAPKTPEVLKKKEAPGEVPLRIIVPERKKN